MTPPPIATGDAEELGFVPAAAKKSGITNGTLLPAKKIEGCSVTDHDAAAAAAAPGAAAIVSDAGCVDQMTRKETSTTTATTTTATEGSSPSALMHRSLDANPHLVTSGQGIYLQLSDGRQILDGCAGAAVAVIGHGSPEVQAAMVAQAQQVSYVHTMAYTTSSAEDLADFILAGRPFGLSKAHFVGSGSEAMDAAIKLARQVFFEKGETRRTRFVARRQAYHGNTVGAMSLSSYVARRIPYENAIMMPNVSFVSAANQYRGPFRGESEEDFAARLVQELDDEFRSLGPETVIAFVAETVVGACAGCLTPPRGYFAGVRRLCDRYGILLILDEVMCGTGRTGTYFAFEQENVVPDIVTVAKGLGGGYAPIAGMLVHEKVVEMLRKGSAAYNHGQTYQAHPLSCAIALAVQKVLKRDSLIEQCRIKGERFGQALHHAFAGCRYVGDIRGRGLFWGLEFVPDRESKDAFEPSIAFGVRITQKAFDLGLAVYPGQGTVDGRKGDHILLAPPLTITVEELGIIVTRLRDAYDLVESEVAGCV